MSLFSDHPPQLWHTHETRFNRGDVTSWNSTTCFRMSASTYFSCASAPESTVCPGCLAWATSAWPSQTSRDPMYSTHIPEPSTDWQSSHTVPADCGCLRESLKVTPVQLSPALSRSVWFTVSLQWPLALQLFPLVSVAAKRAELVILCVTHSCMWSISIVDLIWSRLM